MRMLDHQYADSDLVENGAADSDHEASTTMRKQDWPSRIQLPSRPKKNSKPAQETRTAYRHRAPWAPATLEDVVDDIE